MKHRCHLIVCGLLIVAGCSSQAAPNGTRGNAKKSQESAMSQEASDNLDRIQKTEEQWKAQLTPDQLKVCRYGGTERPFQNAYWDCKKEGVYRCVCCGEPLFSSDHKYDSGTGWPSFYQAVEDGHLKLVEDTSLGVVRTEVQCRRCDAHLGHLFDDGPRPTGMRYCMNSAALKLDENSADNDETKDAK